MNRLTDNPQGNLKKVLRTALVGLKPSDQVLLKGYLRVLLRLEADLEWVSASHPQVDLFIISNEFRHAASITKLLSNQQQKPVLYVSRTDNDDGDMIDDQIILPLKKLDDFNEWLMVSVAALKNGAGVVTTILQQDQNINTAKRVQPVVIDSATTTDVSTPTITSANSINPPVASSTTVQEYQSLIAFIQQLQQRPAGLHQIVIDSNNNSQTVAIVEPSQARVWLPDNTDNPTEIVLSLEWQLQPYHGARPADTDADDLMQWLWQCAWGQIGLLQPLISDEATYQLRYWIKPIVAGSDSLMNNQTLTKKDRQELLRVMTAIEYAPRNVNQLASLANISVNAAKKIIASLLFSGSLYTDSYVQLDIRLKRAANILLLESETLQNTSEVEAADYSNNDTDNLNNNQSALEQVLVKRARGDVAAMTPSSSATISNVHTISQAKPAAESRSATPQPEKRGFLSRLRQKLGLS